MFKCPNPTAMLDKLPPELILNVLGYCCIQVLTRLQHVNKEWAIFISANETTVYHAAAIYHGFVKPNQTLGDASQEWHELLDPEASECKEWKDYCCRRFQLEYNWDGRGITPKATMFRSTGKDVHRFKLDEREGKRFVVTTHRQGGLRVSCMDTDAVLFELGKYYVRQFAHCEYENGFLTFDRLHPHELEIWRLESAEWDGQPLSSNTLYRPDMAQRNVRSKLAASSATYPRRGCFAPWALFRPENNARAYRFVYPTLLVGSEWGQELYLFDVPSATLIQTISIPDNAIPRGHEGVQINYVELGARHAFICTPFSVLILPRDASREASNGVTSLEFPCADPGLRVPQLVRHYAARMVQTSGLPSNSAMHEFFVSAPRIPETSTSLVRLGEERQEFTAVHVSPSGKDFIAITIFGVVYFVRDFERVFRGEATFSDVALRINIGVSALNLAFDNDRVAIQTLHGIFIFSLHTSAPFSVIKPRSHPSQLTPQPAIFPELSAHQLLHFRNPLSLRLVSCLKLTKTAVWLDWSTRAMEEVEGLPGEGDDAFDDLLEGRVNEGHPYANRMVCRIDFAH